MRLGSDDHAMAGSMTGGWEEPADDKCCIGAATSTKTGGMTQREPGGIGGPNIAGNPTEQCNQGQQLARSAARYTP